MCGTIQQLQGISHLASICLSARFQSLLISERLNYHSTQLKTYSVIAKVLFSFCVCVLNTQMISLIKPYCDLYKQATSLEQPAANWPNLGEIARCSQVTSLLQLIGCQTGCSRSLKCLQHDQGTAFFPDTAMCSWKEDTLPRHFLCVPHFVVGPVGICTL